MRNNAILFISNSPDTPFMAKLQQAIPLDCEFKIAINTQIFDEPFDIILLDAALKDLAELIVEVKLKYPCAILIIVSVSQSWPRAREVFYLGVNDCISKSIDIKELEEMLRLWIKMLGRTYG